MWLERDLIAKVRNLSRELVTEHGQAGNSIEALVTEALKRGSGEVQAIGQAGRASMTGSPGEDRAVGRI